MAKKRKKTERKRNLKYGQIEKTVKVETITQNKGKSEVKKVSKGDLVFKSELRRNLIYVGLFFLVLLVFYLIITQTNLLNPVISLLGLNGLYK